MTDLIEKPVQSNPVPASIIRAISTVMLGMSAVKKSQYNKHGNYNYASADDVYASLSMKMAEAGLVSLCLEEGEPQVKEVMKEALDKNGEKVTTKSQWMRVRFSFILATEQDTWTDHRAARTLFIQITGPQTFQAAQSYAEKSWLRSMFKIATGDMDLDGLPHEEDDDAPRKGKKKPEVVSPQNNGQQRQLPPVVGGTH